MLFIDLINKVDKKAVLEYIGKKEGKGIIPEFEELLKNLKQKEVIKSENLKLFIVEQKDYFSEEKYLSVLGYNIDDGEKYALDFNKWSEWLGYEVVDKSVNEIGDVVFVAECLLEMTLLGFDEACIQDEINELIRIEEEIKLGEGKFYTTEEVAAKLNEKYGWDLRVEERSKEEIDNRKEEIDKLIKYNEDKIKYILSDILK